MIKLVIGALLVATTTLAQTTKPKAATATKPTSSTAPTAKSKAMAAAPAKPLPNPSQKEKLESGDGAIPSYKQEKDAGVHKGRAKYPAKQTTDGASKKSQ